MEELKREAVNLLRTAARSARDERTPLYREAAQRLVALRERHLTADGVPDWRGRTWPYRSLLNEIYSEAGLPPESNHPVKAALRYHVNQLLREVAPQDELEAVGMHKTDPRHRQHDRHRQQAALATRARSLVLRVQRERFQGGEQDVEDAKKIVALLSRWLREQ